MDGGEYCGFFCKIEEGCGRKTNGKKIERDAQTKGVFSGRSNFRKNTSEVKELERDSLKASRAYLPLRKSFVLPCVYTFPSWKTAAFKGLTLPWMIMNSEYL